ncbi:MAG: hypothetical protein GY774_04630, partial [Planctomycetes bacterium]|nr:hypothetical protein [Planctomycetota bacterium]
PDDPYSLGNNSLRAIYEDRNGTIWVGTHGGLNKLDREKKQFTRYLHDPDDPNSLSHNLVWSKHKGSNLRLTFIISTGMFNHVASVENRLSECLAPCDEPSPKGARPFC